jgi:multicomponent Na+:H+ antiporter subunit E
MMARRLLISFTFRCTLLFGFWLLLLEPEHLDLGSIAVDWAVGAIAAVLAALLSLRLLPPLATTPRPWPSVRFLSRFLFQSLGAALDVTRRAFDPRLPVRPCLLRQPTRLPGGGVRALFGALTSQVPGTLAVDSGERDRLLYHCLDRPEYAARELAKDEALFLKAIGQTASGGPERRR